MPPQVTLSPVRVSDTAFREHVSLVRKALRTFTFIAALDAPGPAQVAMEELIAVSVRWWSSNIA